MAAYISMAKLLKIGMLKSIKHCSALHRMLLVGEGDMSFGASLARVFGDGGNLTVTSLESLGFFFFFFFFFLIPTLNSTTAVGLQPQGATTPQRDRRHGG
ncbi:hypothetical protein OSB04_020491 [Centaurea solstitialis]|uniref:25S rRNA (uridine-N(3))-methyltransferase BMT5-like domain-containing protein n=1 Tax=Centaurea solstitialis TaxID=347529 RepID=A0AA38SSS4_9ASTR|nr:hypothetical protein OSB04_020491 [Centaurea solstitialis]